MAEGYLLRMIKYIKRRDLDITKYDACIENSIQSRIYALSWYLDVVADNWDVLVLNDYEAVMPIPWKQKFGLKYITQPYFCQQLTIYSKTITLIWFSLRTLIHVNPFMQLRVTKFEQIKKSC